ncbi:hypothetical protein CSHISOI_10078 [Colletotrichum shisoi]|uniref:EC29 protein n=1 Tax=Colletotrichum shisoi TaxID=2078593 RepID=A0A5Q4BEZ2_9PEZI|nr:hypothetical protein CSHISOI_10078 [Colletotrichum shisoi]
MLSHTLFPLAAAVAAMIQPALGLPQPQNTNIVCSIEDRTWTATMTGACQTSGGPAMTCDLNTDLKKLVVKQETMTSALNNGNNQFGCTGYQSWQCCSS